ncbi:MAG: hypothetical protein QM756_46285 [Polyangiaceae bacterium]
MASSSPSFPAAQSADHKSVVSALEAGGLEWQRGDFREAVRWLHRAADAAEAGGDNRRAVGLARAAADIMAQLEIVPESSPRDEAAALASFDDFNDQTIVDPPAIVTARAMQQSGISFVNPGPALALPKLPSPPRPSPPSRPVPSRPPPPKSSALKSNPVASAAPRARRALRVAVTRDGQGGRRLIADVLADGEALPPGASEAWLLLTDPDAPLSF